MLCTMNLIRYRREKELDKILNKPDKVLTSENFRLLRKTDSWEQQCIVIDGGKKREKSIWLRGVHPHKKFSIIFLIFKGYSQKKKQWTRSRLCKSKKNPKANFL